jgi:predicted phage terminase large subunit-like protein
MEDKKLKEIVFKAKNDFFFFCTEVLGFKDLRKDPHEDLGKMLTGMKKRKGLVLMPRGSFKSTEVTTAFPLWLMTKNPNIRILISSETQRNSIKYVKEIKSHLESNPRFKAIFGDYVSSNTWRDNEFIISKRNFPKKEPTVMASSLEKQTIVGLHFDYIILDDVVSRNNINTQEQVQKTIDHYRLLLSVLDPGQDKKMILVGTRWSWVDLYGWILDGEEKDQFEVYIRQALNPDGTLLLPDRLTAEFLEEQRKTQGEFIYKCQYFNTPVAGDTATFRPEDIQYYTEINKSVYTFVSIDPASTSKTTSDYTAIVVVSVDCDENWYVREAMNLKMDLSGIIQELYILQKKYNPMCFLMERFQIETGLKQLLLYEGEKRQEWLTVKDIKTDTRRSKERRIESLQPKFNGGKIFLKREQADLIHQIVHHPQVKNDDLVDALKNFVEHVFPPNKDADVPRDRYVDKGHLSEKEKKIWQNVDKVAKLRQVRRTKWSI